MTEDPRQHLEEVRSKLREAAAEGDEDAAEMLAHVDAYLETETTTEQEHQDLVDRLYDATLRLEVNHPTLAGALQGILHSLTASGI